MGDGSDIRRRTGELFRGGQRCVDCFIELVSEQGVSLPSQVVELAPVLQKGLGSSGAVCSVFVVSLLARAVDEDEAPTSGDAPVGRTVPAQDWLDAFVPYSAESLGAQRCSALAERLRSFATERYGGTDCQSITGVDWPPNRVGTTGLYYSAGGVERCKDFIAEAAQAYATSISPAESGQ